MFPPLRIWLIRHFHAPKSNSHRARLKEFIITVSGEDFISVQGSCRSFLRVGTFYIFGSCGAGYILINRRRRSDCASSSR